MKTIWTETNIQGQSIWYYATRTPENESNLLPLGWRVSGKDSTLLETSVMTGNVAKAIELGYTTKE